MHYYNPITGSHHFNKRKAAVAGDELEFEIKIILKGISELNDSDDLSKIKASLEHILHFSELLRQELGDSNPLCFTDSEFDELKLAIKDVVLFYIELGIKKDVAGALHLTEELAFINEEKVLRINHAIYSLLSYLNSDLHLSVHPRSINDFIGGTK